MKKVFSILDEEPVLSTMGSQSPNMESNNVIEFENVSLAYGNRLILDNVNFKINEGEVLGISGLANSGQREIFNMLMGIDNLEKGKLNFLNKTFQLLILDWGTWLFRCFDLLTQSE